MIVWKPILGHNCDGEPIIESCPWDFEQNPELILQHILSMPEGKLISLQQASELFWERAFELSDQCPPTSQGREPHHQHLCLGIVGYAKSLGYKIVLTGAEYEISST